MVKIVTDSTASVPPAMCSQLGITVVPIPIQFGTDTFIDGVEPVARYYQRLEAAAEPPTTSTPSPGDFLDVYRPLAAEPVISMHVMGTKSTVVNVARLSAELLHEAKDAAIHVVDAETTTMGLGLMVIAAARAAQLGATVEQILTAVHRQIPRVSVFAAIPQLKQLRRSGRVSLTAALLAGMLSIKPILYIGQGMADVVDKVRGWSTAVDRMIEMAVESAGQSRVLLAVVHTNAEAEGRELLERIRSRFNCAEALLAEAGPTLAAHAGPGALGIVTLPLD